MGTALLLFGTMAVFLIIGVPIAFALGASVWATIVFSPDFTVTTGIIAQRIFGGLESTSIMAIPFFILAGNLMTKGGISRRLVNFANSIVGGVRGGMALALVLACAFFAALSGSAPATVIAIGSMLYPEMVKMGYPKDRTAGLLVVSGGLGPIIPPSIIMVVYGTITGASISDMFTSGMFIGVIIMLVLMIVVLLLAHKEQWPKAEKRPTLKEFGDTFLRAIPAILLPVIILGGIYSGLLTPTESAAVAVVWALIAGMFIYREITVKDLVPIFIDSANDFIYHCNIYSIFMDLCLFGNFRRVGTCNCRNALKQDSILYRSCDHSSDLWNIPGRYCNMCTYGSDPLANRKQPWNRCDPFWYDRSNFKCDRYNDTSGSC